MLFGVTRRHEADAYVTIYNTIVTNRIKYTGCFKLGKVDAATATYQFLKTDIDKVYDVIIKQ
jgi:hypothetical protein